MRQQWISLIFVVLVLTVAYYWPAGFLKGWIQAVAAPWGLCLAEQFGRPLGCPLAIAALAVLGRRARLVLRYAGLVAAAYEVINVIRYSNWVGLSREVVLGDAISFIKIVLLPIFLVWAVQCG